MSVKVPSSADLLARAKELVTKMHEVERWAYAVDVPRERWEAALVTSAYRVVEDDRPARVARFEAEGPALDTVIALERPDLGVTVLQAFGPGTVDRLASVLEATGFVPQSRLLARAYGAEGSPEEATRALVILAHMVVAWDDDWTDLFLLHLASPDPRVRHDAAMAVVVASFSAKQAEPARSLLVEARDRESFPKLKETLADAVLAVERMKGIPTQA